MSLRHTIETLFETLFESVAFEYKDAIDDVHGPFQVTEYRPVKDLLSLYNQRKLRKYHLISFNNNNTFTSLHRWKPNPDWLPFSDCLWQLKTYSFYSYTISQIKPFLRSIIFAAVAVLCIFNFSTLFSWKYVYIQYLTIIIVALVCRIITNVYAKYSNLKTDYSTASKSRYVLKLRLQYNNLGLGLHKLLINNDMGCCKTALRLFYSMWHALLVVIGSGNILSYEALKYWFYTVLYAPIQNKNIFYKILTFFLFLYALFMNGCCLTLAPFLIFIIYNNWTDPSLNIQWVIPDRYDIQNDITYFLLKPLLKIKFIQKNKHVQSAVYHILNIVVAEVFSNVMAWNKFNENAFCKAHSCKPCAEIKQQHLFCVEQYLRKRFCVYNYKQEDKCGYENGICDCHSFDHKSMCLRDYEQFQRLHGFMVSDTDKTDIRNRCRLVCSLFFRSSKYLCPVIPIMISSYMVRWILLWIDYGYIPDLKYDFRIFVAILFFLCILWMEPIYNYLIGYKTIVKDMIFWMNTDLLYYCHMQFTRQVEERIVAYMVRLASKLVEKYVCVLIENEIYYDEVMRNNYGFPLEVIQIIIHYLCEYRCIDQLISRNKIKVSMKNYNVDDLKQEIQRMTSHLTGSNNNINNINDTCTQSNLVEVEQKDNQESQDDLALYLTMLFTNYKIIYKFSISEILQVTMVVVVYICLMIKFWIAFFLDV